MEAKSTTETSTSYLELKSTLCSVLEKRGAMEKLRAQVRAELFAEIDTAPASPSLLPPPPPRETILLNELFRDYLRFNGYEHTLSVFLAETAQPQEPGLDRAFLKRELGISEQPSAKASGGGNSEEDEIPLCYALLASYDRVKEMQATLAPLVRRQEALQLSDEYRGTPKAHSYPSNHDQPSTFAPPFLDSHVSNSVSQHQSTSPPLPHAEATTFPSSTTATDPFFLSSTVSSGAAFSPLRTADLATSPLPSSDREDNSSNDGSALDSGIASLHNQEPYFTTTTDPVTALATPHDPVLGGGLASGGLLVIAGSGYSPPPIDLPEGGSIDGSSEGAEEDPLPGDVDDGDDCARETAQQPKKNE